MSATMAQSDIIFQVFFGISKIMSFCSKRIYKIYDFIFIYFDIFGKKILRNF